MISARTSRSNAKSRACCPYRSGPFLLFLLTILLLAHSSRADSKSFGDEPLTPEPQSSRSLDTTATNVTSTSGSLDSFRVLLALGTVLIIILLLRNFGRRFLNLPGATKGNKPVKVLSRSMISPKQHVLLLEVGKRLIVVGDSCGQLSTLCEISEPDEVASLVGQVQSQKAELPAKPFGSLFNRAAAPFSPGRVENAETGDFESPPTPESADIPPDPEIAQTQNDIGSLLQRVQGLRRQFKSDPTQS